MIAEKKLKETQFLILGCTISTETSQCLCRFLVVRKEGNALKEEAQTEDRKKKKVVYTKEQQKEIQKTTRLAFVPGLGQFRNQQHFKAGVFIGLFLLAVGELLVFGLDAFNGLITLGSTPREDHSLFLLIEGTLQVLVTLILLIIYALGIYDANRVAKIRVKTPEKVNRGMRQVLNNVYNNGFAYILSTLR